jgi:regulator of cell morphogenesis and NO signaling
MERTNETDRAEPVNPTASRAPAGAVAPPASREGRTPTFDRTAPIARIVAEHASAAAVFRRYDIDFCCRGDATIAEACREQRLRAEPVVADLERAIAGPAGEPSGGPEAPRGAVVSEIVDRHHAYERQVLPYIASLLPKIAARYRGRDGRLDLLCDAGQDLVETLEAYMEKSERTLLPAAAAGGCEVVRGEIDRHNFELEVLLAHVRSLAGGYVAPDWSDQAYRALMEELESLERDVKERVRVEERGLLGEGDAASAEGPHGGRGGRRARALSTYRGED